MQFISFQLNGNANRDVPFPLEESALTHESIHNYEPAHQNDVPAHVSVANWAKWINSWHLRVRLDSALERTQISSSENLYTHDYFYTRLRCTVDRYSLNRSPSILNSSPLVCIEICTYQDPYTVLSCTQRLSPPKPVWRHGLTDWRTDSLANIYHHTSKNIESKFWNGIRKVS